MMHTVRTAHAVATRGPMMHNVLRAGRCSLPTRSGMGADADVKPREERAAVDKMQGFVPHGPRSPHRVYTQVCCSLRARAANSRRCTRRRLQICPPLPHPLTNWPFTAMAGRTRALRARFEGQGEVAVCPASECPLPLSDCQVMIAAKAPFNYVQDLLVSDY